MQAITDKKSGELVGGGRLALREYESAQSDLFSARISRGIVRHAR